jgi:hypothetical protein
MMKDEGSRMKNEGRQETGDRSQKSEVRMMNDEVGKQQEVWDIPQSHHPSDF